MDNLEKYEKEVAKDGYNKTLARILCKLEELSSDQKDLEKKLDEVLEEVQTSGQFMDEVISDAVGKAMTEEAFSEFGDMLAEHKKSIDNSCKKIAGVFLRALTNQKIATKVGE